MAVIGVDVGGTSVRVGVAAPDGARRLGQERPVPQDPVALVNHITAEWRAVRAADAGVGARPESVVVALPGRTDAYVPQWIPNLPFLDGVPLAQMLAERLGVPVRSCGLVNDGQATLVAEAHEGAAAGAQHALLIVIGTGIGGAMLVDGKLVRGRHGCAGSFGWASAGGASPDGVRGPWEQVASGTALDALSAEFGGGRSAVAAARSGDHRAAAVMTEYGGRLGVGLAALASVLDPDVVVVGGGLSAAFDVLAVPVRAAFERCASPVVRDVPIRAAALGPRAGLLGALMLAGEDGGRR